MISFGTVTNRFNFRAAAIIHQGYSILLHRLENEDFWSLPGGRVEIGETAAESVVRELREELGVAARIERLALLAENFFSHGGIDYHEVGLYFDVVIEPNSIPNDNEMFARIEGRNRLVFRWFPVSDIAVHDVRPAVLKEHLTRGHLPFQHVIHRSRPMDPQRAA